MNEGREPIFTGSINIEQNFLYHQLVDICRTMQSSGSLTSNKVVVQNLMNCATEYNLTPFPSILTTHSFLGSKSYIV